MRFLELKERVRDCIKYGDFTMSSGQQTNWMCDLLEVRDIFPEIMYELGVDFSKQNLFGIETGGYLLTIANRKTSYDIRTVGMIRKSGEIYFGKYTPVLSQKSDSRWQKVKKEVQIIDDVVSTEGTFNNAIVALQQHLPIKPRLHAVLDRRENSTLEVTSLFSASDFGL